VLARKATQTRRSGTKAVRAGFEIETTRPWSRSWKGCKGRVQAPARTILDCLDRRAARCGTTGIRSVQVTKKPSVAGVDRDLGVVGKPISHHSAGGRHGENDLQGWKDLTRTLDRGLSWWATTSSAPTRDSAGRNREGARQRGPHQAQPDWLGDGNPGYIELASEAIIAASSPTVR